MKRLYLVLALLGLILGVGASAGNPRLCRGNSCHTTTTTTTTTPPPSAYPASYFTGPLGANNLIPATGQFLLDQYGGVGCAWDTCGIPGIQQRQADIGRHFDGLGVQKYYGGRADGCTARDPAQNGMEQWVHDNGSFEIDRWNPDGTIGDVNNGLYDACFANLAKTFKAFGWTIMFSPFTEFDLWGNSWQASPSNANGNVNYCGAPFVAAWQRMVGIFQANGATNVGFVWEPTEGANRECIAQSYPGDAYVDWIGTDWYNFSFVGDGSWSSPLHPGWAEFDELFNYTGKCDPTWGCTTAVSQHDAWGPHKPFAVIETETVYDSAYPSKKGQWFVNAINSAKSMKYLIGVMWFDADVTAVEGPLHNFRVDYPTSDPSAYDGFKQFTAGG